MSEYLTSSPSQRPVSPLGNNVQLSKRILVVLILGSQFLGYVILTQIRYEGQGLTADYVHLKSLSDIISASFLLLNAALLLLIIFQPTRLDKASTLTASILSLISLWLYSGIRHTPPEDFSPEAAIVLLLVMYFLLAILLTKAKAGYCGFRYVTRLFRTTILITIVYVCIAFFYTLSYQTDSNISDVASFKADGAVIFGAAVWNGNGLGDRPSPALRERIALGYDLLTKHAVSRIIVTGSNAPGKLAEAEVAKRELIRLGVDPSQIIEETSSHSTLEQVLFLRDQLSRKYEWNRFVIVSDQYHLARVCEMCKFNGLSVIACPSHIHEPLLDLVYYRLRESVALLEYWFFGR